RSKREWSSDVCSSDLGCLGIEIFQNQIDQDTRALERQVKLYPLLQHTRVRVRQPLNKQSKAEDCQSYLCRPHPARRVQISERFPLCVERVFSSSSGHSGAHPSA